MKKIPLMLTLATLCVLQPIHCASCSSTSLTAGSSQALSNADDFLDILGVRPDAIHFNGAISDSKQSALFLKKLDHIQKEYRPFIFTLLNAEQKNKTPLDKALHQCIVVSIAFKRLCEETNKKFSLSSRLPTMPTILRAITHNDIGKAYWNLLDVQPSTKNRSPQAHPDPEQPRVTLSALRERLEAFKELQFKKRCVSTHPATVDQALTARFAKQAQKVQPSPESSFEAPQEIPDHAEHIRAHIDRGIATWQQLAGLPTTDTSGAKYIKKFLQETHTEISLTSCSSSQDHVSSQPIQPHKTIASFPLTTNGFLDALGLCPDKIQLSSFDYTSISTKASTQILHALNHIEKTCKPLVDELMKAKPTSDTPIKNIVDRFIIARIAFKHLFEAVEPESNPRVDRQMPSMPEILQSIPPQEIAQTYWNLLSDQSTQPRETLSELTKWLTAFKEKQLKSKYSTEAPYLRSELDFRFRQRRIKIENDRKHIQALIACGLTALQQLNSQTESSSSTGCAQQ